jgi:hypothetical protein
MSATARGYADSLADRARAVRLEDEIARRGIKLKRQGKEQIGPCPRCGGDDRFSVHIEKNVWHCRNCKTDKDCGDVIGFAQWMDQCDFRTARNWLAGEPQQPSKHHHVEARKVKVAEFEYLDEGGAVAFVVERKEFKKPDGSFVLKEDGKRKKIFPQRQPDPRDKDSWLFNVEDAPIIPYRLPELIEAVANKRTILIVEGEAKADLLRSWNVLRRRCREVARRALRISARRRRGDPAGQRRARTPASGCSRQIIAGRRHQRTLSRPAQPSPKGRHHRLG